MDHLFDLVGRAPAAAARHGLSAIIAEGLPDAPGELLGDARTMVGAGLKTRQLTHAVVDALARAGVVPTMLKGYALALRLYPGVPLGRPSSDVDVLVHPSELDRCGEALRPLGLARLHDAGLEDPFEEHHHLSYGGARGLVEVHFRLFSGFGGGTFDDAGLRARSRPFTLDGRQVRLLGPEDEFLYLATHAANHAFLRLSWLVDLERALALGPPLDWAVMERRARDAGFHTAVVTALDLLEHELGVDLPPGARRHFAAPPLRQALDRVAFSRQRLTSASLAADHAGGFGLRLLLVDSAAHGARHLLEGARRALRRRRAAA